MDGSSEGLLIGYEGEICYGELIGKLKVLESIGNVIISRGPTKGKAYMVGETSFAYQPSPSLQGYDELAIQFIVESNGRKERREIKLRATSLRYYKSAGGTESNPPPGVGVTRYGIAPGSGGAQGRINY